MWLNTPRRPQEASGTSGQKVPVNGGVNLSILDGWWAEAYRGDNGWAIGDGQIDADTSAQDRADAESLYQLLADEVVPRFFARDGSGLPGEWLRTMKASIESVLAPFSALRMVRDYAVDAYLPAAETRLGG